MDKLSQWTIAVLIETSIAVFMAWFNKSDSDFKDGFQKESRNIKENI